MPWNLIIFYGLAAVSILCAIGLVASNNPMHAAAFLVLTFFNVAAVFVMLGAEFLAAVQLIVYAGAILVLVLFVLMLVDPDDLPEFHTGRPIQRAVGLLLGAVLFIQVGVAIATRTVIGQQGNATAENVTFVGGNTQALARWLYTGYLLPFEVISLVLLVGIVGAIVLALPERLGERVGQRRGTISLGHPRGTDLQLPAGPAGETPMPATDLVAAGGHRDERADLDQTRRLILVRDPDAYTTIGDRESSRGESGSNE